MRLVLALSILSLAACGSVTESGAGGGGDGGPGGRVSCTSDSDCPLDQPTCNTDEGLCRGCEASSECAARIGNSVCETASGACVACVADGDCGTETAPFCDDAEFVCRGCNDNDECDSGLCDLQSSTCAPASQVVFVDDGAGTSPSCGAQTMPCGSIEEGFTKAATIVLADPGVDRRYVVLLPTLEPYTTPGEPASPPPSTAIYAVGAEFDDGFQLQTAVDRTVWVGGEFFGEIAPATNASTSPLNCTNGQLRVLGVDIRSYRSAIDADSCDIEVYGSQIIGNSFGLTLDSAGTSIIEGNTINGNEERGIFIQGGRDSRIRSNLFIGNGVQGQLTTVSVSVQPAATIVISYNTLSGNQTDGSGVISCGSGTTVVNSNVIWGNDEAFSDCDIGNSRINGNIVDLMAPSPLLATNSNSNPMFVDADGDDYRLAPESPGIDQGAVLFAPALDVVGALRPSGAGPDIGAYERP